MGGDDEREQTLNQLLVEMDGFDSKGGIIMIAAPIALTSWTPPSSGPDVSPGKSWWTARTCRGGRRSLKYTLEVHARGKLLGDDVNIETIARGTPVLMSPGSRCGAHLVKGRMAEEMGAGLVVVGSSGHRRSGAQDP